MLSNRPIFGTSADVEFFVDREDELATLKRSVHGSLNTLVLGARGSGKTSLMYVLQSQLVRDPHLDVRLVSVASAGDDVTGVLQQLEDDLVGGAPIRQRDLEGAALQRDIIDNLRRQLVRRQEASPTRRTVLLLEGLEGSGAFTLFGRLRDDLWTVPITWIVTLDSGARAELLRPPADAFFDVQCFMNALSDADAVELVRRRLSSKSVAKRSLGRIVELSNNQPRSLVTAARRYEADPSEFDLTSERQHELAQKLALLGRPATMLVAEMQARGEGVSAADQMLQKTMGWTASRLSQVLGDLSNEGLVTTGELRGETGRPRVIYTLIPDLQ